MKKFFVGLGKGLGYFGVYYLMQSTISEMFGMVWGIWLLIRMGLSGGDFWEKLEHMLYSDEFLQDAAVITWLAVMVSGAITILLFMLIGNSKGRKGKEAICWRKLPEGTVLPPVLLGCGLNVMILYLIEVIPFPQSWIEAHNSKIGVPDGIGVVIMLVAAVIAAPIVEEITFRSYVYTRMKKGMPVWLAAVLSSALFGLIHGNMIQGMYTFVLAVLAIWVFERTKSVLASILLHFGFNLIGILSYFLPEEIMEQWGFVIAGIGAVVFVLGICLFLRVPEEPEPEEILPPKPVQNRGAVVVAPWEMEEQDTDKDFM